MVFIKLFNICHFQEYFLEQLIKDNVSPLPKVITADYGTNERHAVYMEGGVLFVTSRILVVDMLTNRVPFDLVTGIIVYKAHKYELCLKIIKKNLMIQIFFNTELLNLVRRLSFFDFTDKRTKYVKFNIKFII